MKKEKTIRSYKRKTKSGKTVTVKQHTAKYDAAEEMKKALAKKGAGEELATRKLTAAELKQVKDIVGENSELDEQYVVAFYPELSPRMVKAVMAEYRKKSATPKAKEANTVGKPPKAPATKTPKVEKSSAPDLGFTAEEYKAWYHWDTENDPKNKAAMKVKKALLGAMGPRAYKKYEEDMTNSYSSRGHSKAYGTLPELVQARKDARVAGTMEKTHKAQAAVAKMMGAKEAEASFTSRAKEQGAKRKEAKKKIGELSPSAKRARGIKDTPASLRAKADALEQQALSDKAKFSAKYPDGYKVRKGVVTQYTRYIKGADTRKDFVMAKDGSSAYVIGKDGKLHKASKRDLDILNGRVKVKRVKKDR